MEHLQALLDKLEAAKFSGTLELRFESGQVESAKLEHLLPFSELGRALPCIGPETEFSLKP
jgi:hypothetical protein